MHEREAVTMNLVGEDCIFHSCRRQKWETVNYLWI